MLSIGTILYILRFIWTHILMVQNRSFNRLQAEQLDDALKAYSAALAVQRPPRGWARALREALGMSAGQLARRVRVSRETIATLERSEARGTITLASLEKLARATASPGARG